MIFGASGRGGGAMARLFFTVTVAGLCLAVSWAGAQPQTEKAKPAEANPPVFTLGTLITGTYREIQRYAESAMGIGVIRSAVESAVLFLESLLGQENVYTMSMQNLEKAIHPPVFTLGTLITGTYLCASVLIRKQNKSPPFRQQFLEMVIRFLAEGAASGLNVIAVYLTEILRVTGFNVAVTLPLFTPEGVTAIAQWGLLALFGYWVLTMLLHLVICVVKRVLWVVKTVLVLWLFGLIVTDKNATADTTAVRLWGLVLGCVLLNLLKSDSEKICSVDNRLRNLEGRLKAVEKRKGE
ncbi:hypothetical protein D4764_09G0005770 [Takifugu flavidus]|uniref:Transmembrane protein 109 n=1 Tax=Takifugu flavidus TaxID=433684 RepID=A0A5C6MLN5_9TELE|nr:hypothetical protein D4764_09G0005770 [Takifugu flavidus]